MTDPRFSLLETTRARLTLQSQPNQTEGGFDILAISAGEGNGWYFSAETLRASLPLWEEVETFIDHQNTPLAEAGRSVRDLAGICHDARWDEAYQGIRLRLRPVGPSAVLLRQLGAEMLNKKSGSVRPDVGFSADLIFSANGHTVESILRVLSVDLVFDPARGGAFLAAFQRALFQTNPYQPALEEAISMSNSTMNPSDITTIKQDESADSSKVAALQRSVCACLLENSLRLAQLPAPAAKQIRNQFKDQIFDSEVLDQAIENARALVADLSAPAQVSGPGRIHGQLSSEERLQAAVDDLFGVPRAAKLQSTSVARLSGIRELYLMLTGDDELHGGYYPERVRLATTSDFTGLVKNAMNKIVVNTWDELGRAGYDWWKRVSMVEHFNALQSITGTLIGTVGSLPSVNEGAAYSALSIGDSPETASFTKYGGYIPLTLELIDRDETRKLRSYPRELAAAGMRKISSLVAAIFTDQAGAGPAMADGGNLFNSDAVSGAGGHANLGTTALSAAAWEAASTAVYDQPMMVKNAAGLYGSGPKMAINPRFLLVPRALQLTAKKILYPSMENAVNITSENQQMGQPGDVITVPEWTDATDWAAVCDPRLAPAVFIGERFGIRPEIFISGSENVGAVFTHDEHRLKVRHFLAVWVNDFRPLYKSNIADV